MGQTYHSDRSFDNHWGEFEKVLITSCLDYIDLESSDRKEDALVSQIDW